MTGITVFILICLFVLVLALSIIDVASDPKRIDEEELRRLRHNHK